MESDVVLAVVGLEVVLGVGLEVVLGVGLEVVLAAGLEEVMGRFDLAQGLPCLLEATGSAFPHERDRELQWGAAMGHSV